MQVEYIRTIKKPPSLAGNVGQVRELHEGLAKQFIRDGVVKEWFPPASVAEQPIKQSRPKKGASEGENDNG